MTSCYRHVYTPSCTLDCKCFEEQELDPCSEPDTTNAKGQRNKCTDEQISEARQPCL